MRLAGKVAIVTGAAQGIGYGIARMFVEEGARVVLADRNVKQGEQVVRELNASRSGNAQTPNESLWQEQAFFVACDVTVEEDIRSLVEKTIDCFGRLDIVVNNAGVCEVCTAEESSIEQWDQVMAINVRSIYLTTKYAVPFMRNQGGGCILNVASISSFVGQKGTPAYTASKGAVLLLTKSLAVDYGPDRIRVNCICPGITDTPMLHYHMGKDGNVEKAIANRLKRVPLGQMLYPEDMGKAAAFLCSEDARGITGASLVIDAGYIACAEFSS